MTFAIAQAIIWFGLLFQILIIVRAVLSWIVGSGGGILGTIFGLVSMITEPFVSPIRRLIQRSPLGGGGMMIDFSPLIAMILMRLLTNFLANLILGM